MNQRSHGGASTLDESNAWVALTAMAQTRERFPLFPLGLVLLPAETVPLHIFEPRYRTLIGECLERDTEFGIVLSDEDGQRSVGCGARVARVLERFEDGRLHILVRGTHPFRLLRTVEDLPYPAGDVELLEDEGEPPDPAATVGARERYADLVERATDERPDGDDLAALDAYGMVATVEVPLDDKQALLEQRSERLRLEQVTALFASAVERIDQAERMAERARGNGRAHP
jgi:Lon protease-like protein